MSLVLRGMGVCDAGPRLVTHGFGSPCAIEVVEEFVPRPGRSGARHRDYQRLMHDVYTITAKLTSVNGIDLLNPIAESVRGEHDRRSDFVIRLVSKIRIAKTTPKKTIFIKVIDVFKRE